MSNDLAGGNPLGVSQLLAPVVVDTDDVETLSVPLPDALLPPQDAAGKWTLKMYKGDCVKCSALFPGDDESEIDGSKQKCHYANGMPLCPAKHVQIEFVGMKVIAVSRLRKAQEKGPDAFLQALTWLGKQESDIRDYALQELGLVKAPVPVVKPASTDVDVSSISSI